MQNSLVFTKFMYEILKFALCWRWYSMKVVKALKSFLYKRLHNGFEGFPWVTRQFCTKDECFQIAIPSKSDGHVHKAVNKHVQRKSTILLAKAD